MRSRDPAVEERQRWPKAIVGYAVDYTAGHSTGRHAHNRAQLVHGEKGVMTVRTDDGAWVVPPGYAVWVPPRMVHEVRAAGLAPGAQAQIKPTLEAPGAPAMAGQTCDALTFEVLNAPASEAKPAPGTLAYEVLNAPAPTLEPAGGTFAHGARNAPVPNAKPNFGALAYKVSTAPISNAKPQPGTLAYEVANAPVSASRQACGSLALTVPTASAVAPPARRSKGTEAGRAFRMPPAALAAEMPPAPSRSEGPDSHPAASGDNELRTAWLTPDARLAAARERLAALAAWPCRSLESSENGLSRKACARCRGPRPSGGARGTGT